MSTDQAHITIVDTIGRNWTIVVTPAVHGFRWTIYSHRTAHPPPPLELLQPGGVAHGWIEDGPEEARDLLVAMMGLKGATVHCPDAPLPRAPQELEDRVHDAVNAARANYTKHSEDT